ncbi:MAG: ATP-binding protein [Ignavibacteriaceae bacterium]
MTRDFQTNIEVDKRILSLLSKSTYQKSFSSAIRELVSNAYDADSLSVNINISPGPDYSKISIEDDGNGMSENEFDKYLTIAATKTSSELTRKYKRKRIGHFGVGFISIFPFCEKLEIISTVENSDEVLTATIPISEFWKPTQINVYDIPIAGKILIDKTQRLKHYTKFTLINPNYNLKQYFQKVDTKKRASIITLDPIDRLIWELQEDLPISFNPKLNSINKIKYSEPVGIIVFVNNKPIFRNELNEIVLESGKHTISGIDCKYIFTTDYKSIIPMEARGIKKRVNNVGIGSRTDFGLRRDRGFSRLHWISGEIHFSEKMKEHLTISRDTFISNPIVDEINEFFANKLRTHAYFVEAISIAEKAIEQSISDSRKGNVKPKKEIIAENIKKLEDKGFKIVHQASVPFDKMQKSPISINKETKTVTVSNQTELKKDYIYILGKNIEIEYKSSDLKPEDSPCRIINSSVVEINPDYSLFKSKTYGSLFKRLHILMAFAKENNITSSEMYNYLVSSISKEFEQLK